MKGKGVRETGSWSEKKRLAQGGLPDIHTHCKGKEKVEAYD